MPAPSKRGASPARARRAARRLIAKLGTPERAAREAEVGAFSIRAALGRPELLTAATRRRIVSAADCAVSHHTLRAAACQLVTVMGCIVLAARVAGVGVNAMRTALGWPEVSTPSNRRRIVAAAGRLPVQRCGARCCGAWGRG